LHKWTMFERPILLILGWTKTADWLAPLAMRLFFGYFWIVNGWAKIWDLRGFAQRFAGWGIPYPHVSAALSAYTELVGGSLLFVGLLTRLVTLPTRGACLCTCRKLNAGRSHSQHAATSTPLQPGVLLNFPSRPRRLWPLSPRPRRPI
jgi:uncharacterized membrane protein YphA (DoxX/SURF4 family)